MEVAPVARFAVGYFSQFNFQPLGVILLAWPALMLCQAPPLLDLHRRLRPLLSCAPRSSSCPRFYSGVKIRLVGKNNFSFCSCVDALLYTRALLAGTHRILKHLLQGLHLLPSIACGCVPHFRRIPCLVFRLVAKSYMQIDPSGLSQLWHYGKECLPFACALLRWASTTKSPAFAENRSTRLHRRKTQPRATFDPDVLAGDLRCFLQWQ